MAYRGHEDGPAFVQPMLSINDEALTRLVSQSAAFLQRSLYENACSLHGQSDTDLHLLLQPELPSRYLASLQEGGICAALPPGLQAEVLNVCQVQRGPVSVLQGRSPVCGCILAATGAKAAQAALRMAPGGEGQHTQHTQQQGSEDEGASGGRSRVPAVPCRGGQGGCGPSCTSARQQPVEQPSPASGCRQGRDLCANAWRAGAVHALRPGCASGWSAPPGQRVHPLPAIGCCCCCCCCCCPVGRGFDPSPVL